MIIRDNSNIDIIQGNIGYGDTTVEDITDWRIENTSAGILNINNSSSIILPYGGTSEIGQIPNSTDRYIIFKGGTSTFYVPPGGIICDLLVVGGGGGGGDAQYECGGGGGGGIVYMVNKTFISGTYNVIVGNGGAIATVGGDSSITFNNTPLSFDGISVVGKGGGCGGDPGGNGGSGGGGNYKTVLANPNYGTATQGNTFWDGTTYVPGGFNGKTGGRYSGGGGGGAGEAGGTDVEGDLSYEGFYNGGGDGRSVSIIGLSVFYGGGGAGGGSGILIGANGGGGRVYYNANGESGTPNTGGGGGGAILNYSGGAGGSGIVILRYSIQNISMPLPLSIISNGNIGFGTAPTSTSKLEIFGDINMNGNYKISAIDVISSTSNYVQSTSNNLLTNILNSRSQWITNNNMIYHSITSTPEATIRTSGITRTMIFTYTTDTTGAGQTQYTINIPTNFVCDILMVAGGGAGGSSMGVYAMGGGGGGAVLYGSNINIPSNTYIIKVGRGALGGKGGIGNEGETQGKLTEGFGAILYGGGSGGGAGEQLPPLYSLNPYSGGSGGGGNTFYQVDKTPGAVGTLSIKGSILTTSTLYSGNIGGAGANSSTANQGGGGGGAGSAGGPGGTSGNATGNGGNGVLINIIGSNYYWGAGGGGSGYLATPPKGGLGGGGAGTTFIAEGGYQYGTNGGNAYTVATNVNDINGLSHSGSGGGARDENAGTKAGNGGSGVIIIKYVEAKIGIGTTNPSSKLHLFDNVINNTILTIQNNYNITNILPTQIVFTPTGSTASGTIGTTDRYISFLYSGSASTMQYTFTINEALLCDILIIGGGGGGGSGAAVTTQIAGGGGAGGVVYMINKILSIGTYKINVGKGGTAATTGATNGTDSSITNNDNITLIFDNISLIGKGGGRGANVNATTAATRADAGGSGGGGGHSTTTPTTGGASTQGNTFWNGTAYVAGGFNGKTPSETNRGGGGGGAGELGDTDGIGYGGDGRAVNITGTSTSYAGGGNAPPYYGTTTTGSEGGGGALSAFAGSQNGGDGALNSGSGGAGAYGASSATTRIGGAGAAGIVIIRYKRFTSSSIELIRGTQNDSNRDYKIGNYMPPNYSSDSDFIIKSSLNGADNDYIKITGSTAAITNPTGTASWTTTSDRRIKENIERASYDKCYESINKLELNRFNYINGFNTVNRDITQLGFIAQEVKEIFPKSVFENIYINDNINISNLHSIDITQINYSLYGAVKKLIEKVDNNVKKIKYLNSILNIDTDTTTTSNIIIDTMVLTNNII